MGLLKKEKNLLYRGLDKSLARPTSRCILFDGENTSFDACLVIYTNSTNIPPIMIINRMYENQRNILHEIRKEKANWIGHILRRNRLLKQVIEGKIREEMEVTRTRGRRRKKLLDDLKDRRGYSHLKEEALDRSMWRNRFGGGFGPVVRQNTCTE